MESVRSNGALPESSPLVKNGPSPSKDEPEAMAFVHIAESSQQQQKPASNLSVNGGNDSNSIRHHPAIIARVSTGNGLIKEVAHDQLGWTLAKKGKTSLEQMDWDVCWAPSGNILKMKDRLNALQKVNHFPGMSDLARKDFLASNLNAMRSVLPEIYNFFPPTYTLPRQWGQVKHLTDRSKGGRRPPVYIIKPQAASQGRGISLTQDLSRIQPGDKCIVQKYLSKPFLIEGYKFDLRIYVVIASVNPLVIYIHKDGLARFATKPYVPPKKKNLKHRHMHLTNYSINKKSPDFDKDKDEAKGSKRSLLSVMGTLQCQGCNTKLLWRRICEIVNRTLLCVQPALAEAYQAHFGNLRRRPVGRAALSRLDLEDAKLSASFEILGFDVLIDRQHRPWLLEVNHMPSFACGSALDRRIKTSILSGVFHLLCPTPIQKHNFLCADKRKWKRRLWNQPKKQSNKKRQEGQEERKVGLDQLANRSAGSMMKKNNKHNGHSLWLASRGRVGATSAAQSSSSSSTTNLLPSSSTRGFHFLQNRAAAAAAAVAEQQRCMMIRPPQAQKHNRGAPSLGNRSLSMKKVLGPPGCLRRDRSQSLPSLTPFPLSLANFRPIKDDADRSHSTTASSGISSSTTTVEGLESLKCSIPPEMQILGWESNSEGAEEGEEDEEEEEITLGQEQQEGGDESEEEVGEGNDQQHGEKEGDGEKEEDEECCEEAREEVVFAKRGKIEDGEALASSRDSEIGGSEDEGGEQPEGEEEAGEEKGSSYPPPPDYWLGTGVPTSAVRYGYTLIFPPQDPEMAKWYTEISRISSQTIIRPWIRLPRPAPPSGGSSTTTINK